MTDEPRYFVQGESIRGEPRLYWVAKRMTSRLQRHPEQVSECTTDRRQAQRWCDKLNGDGA